jgi:hypothetical protein
MAPWWAILAYGGAVALAVVLLWLFHSRSWYWHCASLALAFVLAYIPYPALHVPSDPITDLLIGSGILLLLFWGLGGLLSIGFGVPRHHKHA